MPLARALHHLSVAGPTWHSGVIIGGSLPYVVTGLPRCHPVGGFAHDP
jgi:hypothetical protein